MDTSEKLHKMKRYVTRFTPIFLLTLLLACEENDGVKNPIEIKTNKRLYESSEDIVIEISNLSDSVARYYICSSYDGIPPKVEKLNQNSWTAYWVALCDAYISHCCGELQSGKSYKDTLEMDFSQGTYRLEYEFIIYPSHNYEYYYSPEFQVK